MNPLFPAVLLLTTLIFFTSCGPDYIFDEQHEFEEASWTYEDVAAFDIDITDTLKIFNILLEVVHAPEYSHQNLYTKLHTAFPSGDKLEKVVSLELANKLGQWLADCNNSKCTLLLPIQEGAYFNALGKHTFTIEQYMRTAAVEGLYSIGLKVEDTGQIRN